MRIVGAGGGEFRVRGCLFHAGALCTRGSVDNKLPMMYNHENPERGLRVSSSGLRVWGFGG